MAHDLYRALGDTGGRADTLCNLASLAWRTSDLDRADHLYDQARDLYLGLEAWWHVAKVEQYRGNVAYDRGDLHRIRWLYHRARYALHDGNHPLDLADLDVNLAAGLGELGDHAAALDLLDLYRATLTDDALAIKIAEVEQNRGLAHVDHGELARAWNHLATALRTQRRLCEPEKTADLVRDYPGVASVSLRGSVSEVLRQVADELGNGQPVPAPSGVADGRLTSVRRCNPPPASSHAAPRTSPPDLAPDGPPEAAHPPRSQPT